MVLVVYYWIWSNEAVKNKCYLPIIVHVWLFNKEEKKIQKKIIVM